MKRNNNNQARNNIKINFKCNIEKDYLSCLLTSVFSGGPAMIKSLSIQIIHGWDFGLLNGISSFKRPIKPKIYTQISIHIFESIINKICVDQERSSGVS